MYSSQICQQNIFSPSKIFFQLVSECGLDNNAKLHYTLSTPLEICRGSDPRPLKRGTWGTQEEEDRWISAAHQNLLRSGAMNPLLNHSPPCSTLSTPSTARPCIPKIIHQIWLGSPRPATAEYIKWFDSWQTFHPDWEIRWWFRVHCPSWPFSYRWLNN